MEDILDRVPGSEKPYAKVYGPVQRSFVYGGALTNPVEIVEELWEEYGAFGVELYATASDYVAGASPVAVADKLGCGHAVPSGAR